MSKNDIFQRMRAGEAIKKDDPEYSTFMEAVAQTIRLCSVMNALATDVHQVRTQLSEIIGSAIDESTAIFPPFYTNFGKFISLGKMFLSIMLVHF